MDKYVEQRPWGNFEQFCKNSVCTVKLLNVDPNEALSLQYHGRRGEFWRIISGSALITVGDTVTQAKKDDEFFIPKRAKHRIKTGDSHVTILELSFGQFDEDDIVRLDDKYGRVNPENP